MPYSIFTLLTIIFGLLNFTLLIPLLNVLFGTIDEKELAQYQYLPEFSLSIEYAKGVFNHYFLYTIHAYGRFAALQLVTFVVLTSVLLTNLFRYLSTVELELLKIQTLRNIRNAAFNKILNLHVAYFTHNRKGDIMSRLTNDINTVEASITNSLSVFFKEPITLITFFIMLTTMSVKLTLFTLMVIPMSGLVISFFTKQIKKTAHDSYHVYGRLVGLIDETILGMRVVKAFRGESYVYSKYLGENDLYTKLVRKVNLKRELASPFSELSGVIVVSFILLYGGSLVMSNESELTASEFVAYIILFSQVLRPAKAISNAFAGLQSGVAAGERVFELLDAPVEVHDQATAIDLVDFKQSIEFRNVTFAYQNQPVLHNLNLLIPKGSMVALVGPSGGGKSTIADLIPRFYDIASGTLEIDGIEVKNIKTSALRNLMGIVTQDPILFNDTIYNNILFGKPDASEEEVIHAAQVANAHEFIIKTENGYQTHIGDRGVKLSGGQRQRLSIARAVLKNPPIMILDEATSALDTESEKLVQDALDKLMKNRTSLVIAHRLSTIQNAHKIVVIKEGRVVEEGTHEQLIASENGLYKKLQLMQSL